MIHENICTPKKTGRGTLAGCAIAPVIKITGNSNTHSNLIDNIDLNAGKIMTEGVTVDAVRQ